MATWEQVRDEWGKAEQMGHQAVLQAAKVGQMLIELKAECPHKGEGNFRTRAEVALPKVSMDAIGRLMTLARNLPLLEEKKPESQRAGGWPGHVAGALVLCQTCEGTGRAKSPELSTKSCEL
jgi:hypothetical protein